MLGWDNNNNPDYENFDYALVKNNTMNRKIGTWFKFYRYMDQINEHYDMHIRTKKIKKWKSPNMLDHLNNRIHSDKKEEWTEVWAIKVKPDPIEYTYHAISRTKYNILENHLADIDTVYAAIARLMVETGLRIDAALKVSEKSFRHYLKHMNAGKEFEDSIKMEYVSKGGATLQCDLLIKTIATIQKRYLARLHRKRKTLYSRNAERLNKEYKDDAMWITKNGKIVQYHDIQKAFKLASEKMGHTVDNITPHWLRHTFATWALLDFSEDQKIPLVGTGVTPDTRFLILLAKKLGHASILSTQKYIMTALELMGVTTTKGAIISIKALKSCKSSQELIKRDAKMEFGDDFDIEIFDVFEYAISRGISVDDSWS